MCPDPIVKPTAVQEQPQFRPKAELYDAIVSDSRLKGVSSIERFLLKPTVDLQLRGDRGYAVYTASKDSNEVVLLSEDPKTKQREFLTLHIGLAETRPWTPQQMLDRLHDFAKAPRTELLLSDELITKIKAQNEPVDEFFADPKIREAISAFEAVDEMHSLFNDRLHLEGEKLYWRDSFNKGGAEKSLVEGLAHLLMSRSVNAESVERYLNSVGLKPEIAKEMTGKAVEAAAANILVPFEHGFDPRSQRFDRTTLFFKLTDRGQPDAFAAELKRQAARPEGMVFRGTGAEPVPYKIIQSGGSFRVEHDATPMKDPKPDLDLDRVVKRLGSLSKKDFDELFAGKDVSQANVGNCYLVTVFRGLAELAAAQPGTPTMFEAMARTSIERDPHGYYVSLPLGSTNAQRIFVPNDNIDRLSIAHGQYSNAFALEGSPGWKLLETAYMLRKTGGRFDRNALDGGHSWQSAMRFMAAAWPRTISLDGSQLENLSYMLDQSANKPIIFSLSSRQPESGTAPGRYPIKGTDFPPLLEQHSYAITKIDGDNVTILNPHKGSKPFTLTRKQVLENFIQLDAAELFPDRLFSDAR